MNKIKKNKKWMILSHSLIIAIIIAAYVLLIVGSYFWKDEHWYQVLNPFVEFPTEKTAAEYVLEIWLAKEKSLALRRLVGKRRVV